MNSEELGSRVLFVPHYNTLVGSAAFIDTRCTNNLCSRSLTVLPMVNEIGIIIFGIFFHFISFDDVIGL